MESRPLLLVENYHSETAPVWIAEPGDRKYVGYFENDCGEQWVFVYDFATETGELRGGDVEWGRSYPVTEGGLVDLILSAEERMWLAACWRSATSGRDYRQSKKAELGQPPVAR